MMTLIILLALWELYWTYHACWLAAQRNEKKWFLFFLMFNLLGIPEIIYLQKKKLRRLRHEHAATIDPRQRNHPGLHIGPPGWSRWHIGPLH